MKTFLQEQIELMLEKIQIQSADGEGLLVTIDQKPYQTTFQNLLAVLTQGIYSHFYVEPQSAPGTDELSKELIADYQKNLMTAHATEPRFDKGWVVDSTDTRGGLCATKGNFKRQVFAGEYLYSEYKKGNAYQGDRIELLARKDFNDKQGAFYYVFGRTIGNDNHSQQVRIYFHILPEGSSTLINALSILDEYAIPFSFKCLNTQSLYFRADSAVLYLDKQYVNYFFQLLPKIEEKINDFLLSSTPRFTRVLKKGIGFAESPPNPNESFGTSRSQLIAQGIAQAFQQKQPTTTWAETVLMQFRRINISETAPYLNPGSQYPYQFPTL